MEQNPNDLVVQMKGITKVYPNGIAANQGVDFSVRRGEIHALMGENGAGKSTLMKMLFGLEQPTEGEMLVNGEKVSFASPTAAIAHGIGMVHQHFMLVPSLTVAENIVLGMVPKKGGMFIDFQESDGAHARICRALQPCGESGRKGCGYPRRHEAEGGDPQGPDPGARRSSSSTSQPLY